MDGTPMKNCQYLILSRNKLTKINLGSVFKVMPCLKELDLSQNLLTDVIHGGFVTEQPLQILNLSRNNFNDTFWQTFSTPIPKL